MGIIAIDAINIEGQTGTAAIMRDFSNSQTNVDFATELGRTLQGKTNPTLTSGVTTPDFTLRKGNTLNDGNLSQQAADPSTAPLDTIMARVPVAASSNSTTGNGPAPKPEQTPTVSSHNAISLSLGINSALAVAAPDEDLIAPSANKPALAEPSSSLSLSHLPQVFATEQPRSTHFAGSIAPSGNKVTSAKASPPLQPPRLAQDLLRGQHESAYVAESTSKHPDALNATNPSRLAQGSLNATEETLVPLRNGMAQPAPQSASASPNLTAEALASKDPKASSVNQAKPGEASMTFQPSRLAQAFATGQAGSAHLAGPITGRRGDLDESSPSKVGEKSQSASVTTAASLQNGTAESGPQVTSKQMDTIDAPNPSKLGKGSQGPTIETFGSSPDVKTQVGPVEGSILTGSPHGPSPSKLGKGSQGPMIEMFAPSPDVTAKLGLDDPSSGPNPKTEASQNKGSEGSPTGQANPDLVPASIATLPLAATLQATGRGSLNNGLKGVGVESTVRNLGKGLQAVGMETPASLHQGATPAEAQDISSSPGAGTHQQTESGPGIPSSAQVSIDTNVQASTVSPLFPDFSQSIPFELTKAVSIGQVDDPPNSTPVKNPQEVNHTAIPSSSDFVPAVAADAAVQGTAQTKDTVTTSPVHDNKQADASTDKKNGEATPDFPTVLDGKGSLPKTNAEPPLTPQLTPDGQAEAVRVSSQAGGASLGRGEADSTSILRGYQANAQAAVRSARFTQQAGNAEMQLRLRTEALGPIDVRTIVKGSDIGASIRVEARDTQVMLANALPQLERALNERSFRVEHLDVLQGLGSGGQSNGNGRGNSGSPSEPRPSFSSNSTTPTYTSLPEAPNASEDGGLGLETTRINLRV